MIRLSRRLFHPDRRMGAAFVLVLWITTGLTAVALVFGQSMLFEYRASDNALAGMQAAHAIESAHRYAALVLRDAQQGGLPDVEDYESEAVAVGEARFWILGRDSENANAPAFGIIDEASKLNLNQATQEMLEALPNMTPELAAAIIDWRDPDEELTPGGAESQDYLLREPNYNCKNSGFESIEELRLVEGMTSEILYGEDTNRNGILDPNEDDGEQSPPSDNQDGRLDCGLIEYVTVFSRDAGGSGSGPLVNLNDGGALSDALKETFGENRSEEILGAVGPEYTSVLEFLARSQMTPDEIQQIGGRLTTSDEPMEGLVNVNAASEIVLRCVPGIGEEYADAVVSYREGKDEELKSVAWLLEVLDPDSAAAAGPFVTTTSCRFSIDVAAVGFEGRGYRREFFVLDVSGNAPIAVYRRDRSRMGWALGVGIWESLRSDSEERSMR